MKRVDAMVVVFIVTEYDEQGRPIADAETQPMKIFTVKAGAVEAEIAKLNAQFAQAGHGQS